MKITTTAVAGAFALAATVALAGCSGSSNSSSSDSASASSSSSSSTDLSSLSGSITAGGSSAQANAQTAWTAAFTAQATGVKVNYDKSQGSGGGVTNWLAGSYDFAGTDAALTAEQYSQTPKGCAAGSKGLDIPVYLSGVDIIYKLQGVSSLNLDASTIASIFAGKITTWNDPAIAALNKGVTLPSTPISVVHRSDGSGTTANFTTYLSQQAPSVWTSPAGSAWPNTVGTGAKGGSGVVTAVEAGNGTIGYADQSSIGSASAAKVEVGSSGTFSAYSSAGATQAFDEAATVTPQGTNDLTVDIDTTKITSTSAYPIPLLSYDVVCQTFSDSTQGSLTQAYLNFVTSSVGQQVGEKNAGAAPLPQSILTKIAASLATVK